MDGSQNWISLMMGTMETETTFLAESGHTYTFRVTARDRVSNAGQDEASVQTWSVVKFYGFANQRVAMRRCGSGNCGEAVYLHGDIRTGQPADSGSVLPTTYVTGTLVIRESGNQATRQLGDQVIR
jgi:hypothetical protein